MDEPVKLAVRELTEFLLQSGSIDNRFGGADRALLGTKLHRKLQKEAGPGYEAEVPLSMELLFHEKRYVLEGRADGIFTENGLLTVDEIKSTGVPLEMIEADFNAAHWGQARCYAYILSVTRGLEQMALRLTYIQVDTLEVKRFFKTETMESLELFIQTLLGDYEKWVLYRQEWEKTRTASIKALPFPFPYRAGQRELAVAVYRTIQQKGRLFCQAPTGIGKTLSTLFPAVKAMGEGLAEHIFYLTAKTITRQAGEEAYGLLRRQGLRMKTVTLTAKDKLCFLEERNCNPELCPYADGYYNRARDAVYALLTAPETADGSGDAFTRDRLEEAARAYHICPFELSLDLSLWCEGIICDYNYLFDPVASLQRYFADKQGDYVFLVDEAHNLVDRAREMYSASLVKSDLMALKKSLGKGGGELRRSLRELNAHMVALRKLCGTEGFLVRPEPEEALCNAAARFSAAASLWLEEHREATPLRRQLLERSFEISFFLRILEFFDGHYRALYSAHGSEVVARLLCLDPSALLSERLEKGRGAVLFSATLSPLNYYREVLGGGPLAKRCALPSPFPQENLCLLCAGRISTKFRDREASLIPIAQMLYTLISARQGNYLAYFPSYRYLQDVYELFRAQYPQVDTIVQTGAMDEAAREGFLLRFESGGASTLLGFCVLGGIFSEGVDLKGDRLIGTAVVGVGLPQLGPEPDLLRDYYNEKSGMGFEYAYRYPGMNKVLQAAGRVIRGPEDCGVALLIDSRFPENAYQTLFPAHWSHWRMVNHTRDLSALLSDFWKDS